MTRETQIRLAVFEWLEEQSILYDDVLPWSLLQHGFFYQGQKISLVGQQGVWKPSPLYTFMVLTRGNTWQLGPYLLSVRTGGI